MSDHWKQRAEAAEAQLAAERKAREALQARCDSISIEEVDELRTDLANERSKIVHCIKCSWYDSGFTTSCPICELVEERKEKQAALEEVFRLSGC